MRILATLLCAGLALSPAAGALASEADLPLHEPVGQQVDGAQDQASAPQLEAGQWVDELPTTGDDSALYYRLPQIADGERLHVSAQLVVDPSQQPTSQESTELSAALVQANGDWCDRGSNSTSRRNIDNLPLVALDSQPKKAEGYSRCLDQNNDELYLSLQRDGRWQDDAQLPVQITVVVQPALDPATLTGTTPGDLPPVSVTLDAEPQAVSGGSGFSTAAELSSGAAYSDSVLPNEVKYYKVHVAQGQRLNYRMTVLDSPNASAKELVTGTYNPLLQKGIMTGTAKQELSADDAGASLTRSLATTVSRDLQVDGSHPKLGYPGDYYITVAGTAYEPRGLNPLNFELAIEVTGEATGTDGWEPAAQAESGGTAAGSGSWLPGSAQLGALAGGAAVALAGYAGLWFWRRRAQAAGKQRA